MGQELPKWQKLLPKLLWSLLTPNTEVAGYMT